MAHSRLAYRIAGEGQRHRKGTIPVTPELEMGLIVATGCAALALAKSRTHPEEILDRHRAGDFGEVDSVQRQANRDAIEKGGRVRSIYRLATGERLHVITEVGITTSITCVGEV